MELGLARRRCGRGARRPRRAAERSPGADRGGDLERRLTAPRPRIGGTRKRPVLGRRAPAASTSSRSRQAPTTSVAQHVDERVGLGHGRDAVEGERVDVGEVVEHVASWLGVALELVGGELRGGRDGRRGRRRRARCVRARSTMLGGHPSTRQPRVVLGGRAASGAKFGGRFSRKLLTPSRKSVRPQAGRHERQRRDRWPPTTLSPSRRTPGASSPPSTPARSRWPARGVVQCPIDDVLRLDHLVDEAQLRRPPRPGRPGRTSGGRGPAPGRRGGAGSTRCRARRSSPRRAKAVVNLAPAAAKRRSHISAWHRPMPAHAPLMAAMTGLGIVVVCHCWRRGAAARRAPSPACRRRCLEHVHVGPGAEAPTGAGDDDRPHVGIGRALVERSK